MTIDGSGPIVGSGGSVGTGRGVGGSVTGAGRRTSAPASASVSASGWAPGGVTTIDAVVFADQATPSQTRYVNVNVPTNDPPDLYVKLPSDSRSNEPLPPPSISSTDRASPSASVSFASTPGAATLFITPVVAVYEVGFGDRRRVRHGQPDDGRVRPDDDAQKVQEAGLVGERIGAGVARGRPIREAAVGAEGQRPVGRVREARRRRGARIVVEDAGRGGHRQDAGRGPRCSRRPGRSPAARPWRPVPSARPR